MGQNPIVGFTVPPGGGAPAPEFGLSPKQEVIVRHSLSCLGQQKYQVFPTDSPKTPTVRLPASILISSRAAIRTPKTLCDDGTSTDLPVRICTP